MPEWMGVNSIKMGDNPLTETLETFIFSFNYKKMHCLAQLLKAFSLSLSEILTRS